MGYALELNYILSPIRNKGLLYGKTLDECLEIVKQGTLEKMNQYLNSGTFSVISSYDSTISEGEFRVALRIGFLDFGPHNGVFDIGEPFDFHFWYQTSYDNGTWADKPDGVNPSRLTSVNNGADPASVTWSSYDGSLTFVYNSDIVYFKLTDYIDNNWVE